MFLEGEFSWYIGVIYILIVNLIGFCAMGIDKRRARRHEWRISESTLIAIALLGGSIGSFAGMKKFRHKTKHAKFYVGIPVILALQLICLVGIQFLMYR